MKKILYVLIGVAMASCSSSSNPNSNSDGVTQTEAPSALQKVLSGVSFTETQAPADQYAAGDTNAAYNMSIPFTGSKVRFSYSDGSSNEYTLEHKMLFRSDDVIPFGPYSGEYYGGIVDRNGAAVLDSTAAQNPHYEAVKERALAAGLKASIVDQYVADTPDGSTLIQVPGAATSATSADLSYLTQFEYVTWNGALASQYGNNPMFIGHSVLNQDLMTGVLSMKNFDKVTFASDQGLWIPCAASKSPWNTHIGSEEYEPDARNFYLNSLDAVENPLDFSNGTLVEAFQTRFQMPEATPYNYGYVTESSVNSDGIVTAVKHYATGRWARELIKMMPDGRTYYSGDDGKSTVLFMGVADTSGDLSAVTLYAAKATQASAVGEAAGDVTLSWIKLGHASNAEVKSMIDDGINFSDIFDSYLEPLPDSVTSDSLTADGYSRVFNYYHPNSKGKAEWLKLKQGQEQAAAFLETRRYAALLGATSEFTKMEGVALNEADKKVYVAISYQYKSMSDGSGDIQFGLMDAGATYEMALANTQKDRSGNNIDSDWVATSFSAISELVGQDNPRDADTGSRIADAQGNFCAINKVANADNLKFSTTWRTLFIGEDSNCHINNFVWAFNVDTRTLTRILSLPLGAEATGLMAVDDINGFSYIGTNYQHPGDSGVGAPPADLVNAVEAANPDFAPSRNRSGGVGYLYLKGMPRNM
ncbi:MAG: DUF839 domain-containing protein [Mariprofundaceae bacterium]|nr:DUF839 domain-containing protein [Mariprofundaceae bacterium]